MANDFKVGDMVYLYRMPTDGAWPSGFAEAKNALVTDKSILSISNELIGGNSDGNTLVKSPRGQIWTVPINCLKLYSKFKRPKPIKWSLKCGK